MFAGRDIKTLTESSPSERVKIAGRRQRQLHGKWHSQTHGIRHRLVARPRHRQRAWSLGQANRMVHAMRQVAGPRHRHGDG